MFQGLRTVVYEVADLGAAKQWYAQVLGRPPYFDEPFYVGFTVGGYELGLLPSDAPAPPVAYWGVPDADAAFASLVAHGAKTHEVVHDVGGGIRLGSVTDPFGSTVGVIFNPHFAPD